MISVDNFEKQINNIKYKNEIYSARDNGAVMRHPKNPEKPRRLDDVWTFGKQNSKTGYMEISAERVHRIVATGFLGEAPTKDHLVDHIDTNRANNSPENLRWVTKLENILLNEATRRRIAYKCGSVENFLSNPAKYRNELKEPNLAWMCTVSKEEAQNCLNRLKQWAKLDDYKSNGGKIDKWIFKPLNENNNSLNHLENNVNFSSYKEGQSLTKNAKQDWSTPTKFPCCPEILSETPLKDYYNNLKEGSMFGENRYTQYKILRTAFYESFILVLTEDQQENPIKPWCVSKITFDNNYFYHSVIKTCFDYNGAEKFFTVGQGVEWNGSDSIDDYC